MKAAAKFGGRIGQYGSLAFVVGYFLKGRSVGLRFLYGFLYGYWISHFFTLGSYLGTMVKLPSTPNPTQRRLQSCR